MSGGKDDDGGRSDGKPSPGFKVNDRRSSSQSATAATPPAAPATEPVSDASAGDSPAPAPTSSATAGERPAPRHPATELPPIDFHTFILSLGSSALLHLGELDGAEGEPNEPDLALAKHTIDVIAMLQAKTTGNLTPPEANLIESLLYDLRLRFVEKTKAAPSAP